GALGAGTVNGSIAGAGGIALSWTTGSIGLSAPSSQNQPITPSSNSATAPIRRAFRRSFAECSWVMPCSCSTAQTLQHRSDGKKRSKHDNALAGVRLAQRSLEGGGDAGIGRHSVDALGPQQRGDVGRPGSARIVRQFADKPAIDLRVQRGDDGGGVL